MSDDVVIKFEQAVNEQAQFLAELRAKAMKPSLEAVGRFDENRVRNRLLDSFDASITTVIKKEETIVGFYTLEERVCDNGIAHMFIHHLYLDPSYQGLRIGEQVMAEVKKVASSKQMSIRLTALKESRSNKFYLKNGFVQVSEDEFDNVYEYN